MSSVIKKRNKQGGFSFMELMIALIIFIVAVALVIMATRGSFTKSRGAAMAGDIHTVQNAVADYMLQSMKAPTESGALPPTGQYDLIDGNATFERDGKTVTFYPDFISKLPRHWDEGVWRIGSTGNVSVDMPPDKY